MKTKIFIKRFKMNKDSLQSIDVDLEQLQEEIQETYPGYGTDLEALEYGVDNGNLTAYGRLTEIKEPEFIPNQIR